MGTLEVSPKRCQRCHYDGMPGDKVGRDLFDLTACMHGLLPSTPRRFGLTFARLDSKIPVSRVQTRAPHITKRAVKRASQV